jgi:hypothetical protein
MNPELTDLYAGLSGISLVPTTFDLGHGIQISQTYAHFMAPFLMAFKPPSPGKPHPAPWKSASGGLAIGIAAELSLPLSYRPGDLDRLNTIWWIVALLRLKVGASVFVPVVSSERFAGIPSISEEPELLPIEIHLNRLVPYGGTDPRLGTDDLEWLKSHWEPGSQLLKNEDFSTAFISVDSCLWNSNPALALVMIWGALERLFSTSHQELSFRVSANLATFLEVPGSDRLTCLKRVKSLLVHNSDILVGMFWTKIGTNTGIAESGTVEEIDQFVAAAKPAMLYFSRRPIDPNVINLRQQQKLRSFKSTTY